MKNFKAWLKPLSIGFLFVLASLMLLLTPAKPVLANKSPLHTPSKPALASPAADTCPATVDIMIMLDRTGSMTSTDRGNENAAAKALLGSFATQSPAPKIGVGTVGGLDGSAANVAVAGQLTNTQVPAPYGQNSPASGLYTAINTATATSSSVGTNLAADVNAGQGELTSVRGTAAPNILIIISDGDPNRPNAADLPGDIEASLVATDAAKNAGTEIYSIFFGTDPAGFAGKDLLGAMATGTVTPASPYNLHLPGSANDQATAAAENTDGDHLFWAPDSAGIQDVFNQIVSQICKTPKLLTQINPPAHIPGNLSDTANLTGVAGSGAVSGSVAFFLCSDTVAPYALPQPGGCTSGGTQVGSSVAVTTSGTNPPVGTATSATTNLTVNGFYCFRAEFTSTNANYFSTTHTNALTVTTDGVTPECLSITDPTAVTLSSFRAAANDNSIELNWTTASEVKTAGYNLYRSDQADGPYTRINTQLIPSAQDQLAGGSYQYTDQQIVPGTTYYYQLEDVEFDGTGSRHQPITASAPAASNQMQLLGVIVLGSLVLVLVGGLVFSRRSRRGAA